MSRTTSKARRVLLAGMVCTAMSAGGVSALGAVPATAATAAALGSNLIVDAGAEQATASSDGYSQVALPGWTVSGSMTAVSYATGNGFPSSSSPGSPTRGTNFFAGGNAPGSTTATQTEDVSALAAQVDTGAIAFDLSGWLGGYSSQSDAASLSATFLSASGSSLGSSTIGPVTAADRGNTTGMLQRASTGGVPAGTRSIRVVLTATQTYGYNDGYADDLSLTLSPRSTSGNLLVNPGVETGEGTTGGYDQTIIPGWQQYGTVTSIAYGTAGGFPSSSSPGSPTRGGNFFAGGAEGDSSLTQTADISSAATAVDAGGVTANLSGWLGGYGSQNDGVTLTATFQNASGGTLGSGTVGPVTASDRGSTTGMLQRSATLPVPTGTRKVKVVAAFTVASGPYNDGYADDLSLTLSTPVTAPAPPTPPVSTVPGFDHVFLVMMENQDYSGIIGNTSGAPYLNSLAAKYASSTNQFALAHPSDPNYVGLFSGSMHGLTSNTPTTRLPGTNLADVTEAAGKTWKFYNQNMPSPCYTSQSGNYYPDDLPFTYFSSIVDNAARCQSHVLPLTSMATDLAATATTPNFVWFSADDYYDMEAGGVTAGDTWLSQTLPTIFNSPAWKTQRSLLIVTWDEDDKANDQTPEQHVPTLVIGSPNAPVKSGGYTSSTWYDHYSITRTIEAGLGLPAMTANDAYAPPMNDFFTQG
ncbi:hypothetical protein ABIA33_003224 [Streptacidiphilus sp. MAP12-16]|uniref:alkaline phosphatase family protein n=1 Tax=Streptacidiphilus sp. MAP12-16 TaxID=3156300 RepID=UPI003513492A